MALPNVARRPIEARRDIIPDATVLYLQSTGEWLHTIYGDSKVVELTPGQVADLMCEAYDRGRHDAIRTASNNVKELFT